MILLIILIPSRIKIKYEVDNNFDKNEKNENLDIDNYIKVYIFYFIKIKKIKIEDKEKVDIDKSAIKKTSFKLTFDIISKFLLQLLNIRKIDEALITKQEIDYILKQTYIEKLELNLGFNLKEVILNAYLISLLNAVINMFFAKNIEKINFKKTKYCTYISDKVLNIKIDSIIRFNFANTMIVILKILLRYRKVVKKDGKSTSNRKFNDDSYDFT